MFPPFGLPYRFPYNRYSNRNYYNYKKNENSITNYTSTSDTVDDNSVNNENRGLNNNFKSSPISIGPLRFNPNSLNDNTNPVFDVFGIHLFLDDIIIIGLLIFLYQEDTKDEILFIILFLLLFS